MEDASKSETWHSTGRRISRLAVFDAQKRQEIILSASPLWRHRKTRSSCVFPGTAQIRPESTEHEIYAAATRKRETEYEVLTGCLKSQTAREGLTSQAGFRKAFGSVAP